MTPYSISACTPARKNSNNKKARLLKKRAGGAKRIRTAVNGFADRYLTTRTWHHGFVCGAKVQLIFVTAKFCNKILQYLYTSNPLFILITEWAVSTAPRTRRAALTISVVTVGSVSCGFTTAAGTIGRGFATAAGWYCGTGGTATPATVHRARPGSQAQDITYHPHTGDNHYHQYASPLNPVVKCHPISDGSR